jgi:hypothetical protein
MSLNDIDVSIASAEDSGHEHPYAHRAERVSGGHRYG